MYGIKVQCVQSVSEKLTEYCDEVKTVITDLCNLVKAQSHNASESITSLGKISTPKHQVYKWKCETCNITFRTTSELSDHKKTIHDGHLFKCSVEGCMKTYSKKASLKNHEKRHDPKNRNKMCEICSELFFHESKVAMHKQMHEEWKHGCDRCGKSYSYKSALNRHVKTWGNTVKCQCTQCGKEFSDKHYLKDHMQTKHATGDKWLYECKICDGNVRFQYWQTLRKHNLQYHTSNLF